MWVRREAETITRSWVTERRLATLKRETPTSMFNCLFGERLAMEIYGPGYLDGPQSIQAPHRTKAVEPKQSADGLHGPDSVDLSPEAEIVGRVQDVPDLRTDRIAQIRAEIAAGTYETEAKMEIAVGRLLDEIG
jgi:negative regulator of flagellin synthesis FlgM